MSILILHIDTNYMVTDRETEKKQKSVNNPGTQLKSLHTGFKRTTQNDTREIRTAKKILNGEKWDSEIGQDIYHQRRKNEYYKIRTCCEYISRLLLRHRQRNTKKIET